jgi:hypothetical protein
LRKGKNFKSRSTCGVKGPACRRKVGGRDTLSHCSHQRQHPVPWHPAPGTLTLITVTPSKSRAAPPFQRCHRAVGHSVRGPNESPVANTKTVSVGRELPPTQPTLTSAKATPGLCPPRQWACHPGSVLTDCVTLHKSPALSVSGAVERPFQPCLSTAMQM